MRFLSLAILAFTLSFTSVSAEQPAAWPRHGDVTTVHSYAKGPRRVTAPAATYNPWTDDFIPFASSKAATTSDGGGQFPTSQAELDAQQRAYRQYWAQRNAELFRDGNLADVLPVRVHERLWPNAFGSPVMSGNN